MTTLKDFQIISRLGEGTYSSVFRVKRLSDGQEYALKKVKLQALNEKERENALNEVRLLASITDNYIVGYKEAFMDDTSTSLCIIMEYASGGDIYQKIVEHQRKGSSFSEKQLWRFIGQMVRGLKTLHDLNILHRDLKCANVFVVGDGNLVKLGDLNVSKVAKNNLVYTQTGTPYYASPEVWKDQPYDKKSDIWSLGCVIYEMITLRPPFRGNDMQQLYRKILKGIYEKIPSKYSQDLSNLIAACLKVNPAHRPTCDELLKLPEFERNVSDVPDSIQKTISKGNLLNTIKVPRNLKAIKLPKANYEQSEVASLKGPSFLPQISGSPALTKQKMEPTPLRSQSGHEPVPPSIRASQKEIEAYLAKELGIHRKNNHSLPRDVHHPGEISEISARPTESTNVVAKSIPNGRANQAKNPYERFRSEERKQEFISQAQQNILPTSSVDYQYLQKNIPNYYNKNLNYHNDNRNGYMDVNNGARQGALPSISKPNKVAYPDWWG